MLTKPKLFHRGDFKPMSCAPFDPLNESKMFSLDVGVTKEGGCFVSNGT
jgi:hypothetical protein